jgi:hypothetical protein
MRQQPGAEDGHDRFPRDLAAEVLHVMLPGH